MCCFLHSKHLAAEAVHAPWSHGRQLKTSASRRNLPSVASKAERLAHRHQPKRASGHLFTPPGLIAANPKQRQRRRVHNAIRPLLPEKQSVWLIAANPSSSPGASIHAPWPPGVIAAHPKHWPQSRASHAPGLIAANPKRLSLPHVASLSVAAKQSVPGASIHAPWPPGVITAHPKHWHISRPWSHSCQSTTVVTLLPWQRVWLIASGHLFMPPGLIAAA